MRRAAAADWKYRVWEDGTFHLFLNSVVVGHFGRRFWYVKMGERERIIVSMLPDGRVNVDEE
jgi:hypothetical protein